MCSEAILFLFFKIFEIQFIPQTGITLLILFLQLAHQILSASVKLKLANSVNSISEFFEVQRSVFLSHNFQLNVQSFFKRKYTYE